MNDGGYYPCKVQRHSIYLIIPANVTNTACVMIFIKNLALSQSQVTHMFSNLNLPGTNLIQHPTIVYTPYKL